ncbi:uncharacterized protein [Anas acuta]|uniref:uncharacterized protein n=1 Tax=Anas acuta TaxID=28680 RepID=UPI0035C8CFDB
MHMVWEADRKYQMLTLSSVETLALRNRLITMDEDQHSYSEESIPLSLLSWFWKKKRNFASPAAKSQSRTDAWVRTVTPSCSCVPDDPVRSEPQPKPQSTIHSSVPLPGSVMNFSGEIQEHPSCVIKSVMLEETPEQDEEGKFWLHKVRMSINKWSLLNSLIGWSENRPLEKALVEVFRIRLLMDKERIHVAKTQLELKMTSTVGENKKDLLKDVNIKRGCIPFGPYWTTVGPILDEDGHLTNGHIHKAEMFNDFTSFVFNTEDGPWEPQSRLRELWLQ